MNQSQAPEANPKALYRTNEFKRHQKQRFWQIYLPLFITLALFIGVIILAVLTTTNGDPDGINKKWASITLILLISVISLFAIALAVGLFYFSIGMGKGIHGLPAVANQVLKFMRLVNHKVQIGADAVVSPIIRMHGTAKGFGTFTSTMTGAKKRNQKKEN